MPIGNVLVNKKLVKRGRLSPKHRRTRANSSIWPHGHSRQMGAPGDTSRSWQVCAGEVPRPDDRAADKATPRCSAILMRRRHRSPRHVPLRGQSIACITNGTAARFISRAPAAAHRRRLCGFVPASARALSRYFLSVRLLVVAYAIQRRDHLEQHLPGVRISIGADTLPTPRRRRSRSGRSGDAGPGSEAVAHVPDDTAEPRRSLAKAPDGSTVPSPAAWRLTVGRSRIGGRARGERPRLSRERSRPRSGGRHRRRLQVERGRVVFVVARRALRSRAVRDQVLGVTDQNPRPRRPIFLPVALHQAHEAR